MIMVWNPALFSKEPQERLNRVFLPATCSVSNTIIYDNTKWWNNILTALGQGNGFPNRFTCKAWKRVWILETRSKNEFGKWHVLVWKRVRLLQRTSWKTLNKNSVEYLLFCVKYYWHKNKSLLLCVLLSMSWKIQSECGIWKSATTITILSTDRSRTFKLQTSRKFGMQHCTRAQRALLIWGPHKEKLFLG